MTEVLLLKKIFSFFKLFFSAFEWGRREIHTEKCTPTPIGVV